MCWHHILSVWNGRFYIRVCFLRSCGFFLICTNGCHITYSVPFAKLTQFAQFLLIELLHLPLTLCFWPLYSWKLTTEAQNGPTRGSNLSSCSVDPNLWQDPQLSWAIYNAGVVLFGCKTFGLPLISGPGYDCCLFSPYSCPMQYKYPKDIANPSSNKAEFSPGMKRGMLKPHVCQFEENFTAPSISHVKMHTMDIFYQKWA